MHTSQSNYIKFIVNNILINDMDVILLAYRYVPAAIWSNEGASLEITNAAFCLSNLILEDMMAWCLRRIKDKVCNKKFNVNDRLNLMFTLFPIQKNVGKSLVLHRARSIDVCICDFK